MIDVEILLQKADISLSLNKIGIQFQRRKHKNGHELYFACPTHNHNDDPNKLRASMAESGKYKGMFNCWACGFKGNLVHLIKFHTGWSFRQIISYLENDYGSSSVVGTQSLIFRLKMNKPERAVHDELPTYSIPDSYRPICSVNTKDAELAKKWLIEERNIDYESMKKFEIGVGNHSDLGFCIIIPVIFCDRIHSIFYAQPFKGGLKRYPKGSPQGDIFFNFDSCFLEKKYVMFESILDVIKYECVTRNQGMACFTNMISDNQLKMLQNFEEHGVMPDLDGERGWDLVNRMLKVVGKSLWIEFCPIGKDPGDCTPQELIDAHNSRVRYCDYESNQIIQSMNRKSGSVTRIMKM